MSAAPTINLPKSVFHRPTHKLDVATEAVKAMGEIGVEAVRPRLIRRSQDARVARIALDNLRVLVLTCLDKEGNHGRDEAPASTDDARDAAADRGEFGRSAAGTP